MTLAILLKGIAIFFARIADVSLGTMRTIVTVQGRSGLAFMLGFVEVSIWIVVVSAVVASVQETPVLLLFYASGFAAGNVAGIELEKKMALGFIVLRVVTRTAGESMAGRLRQMGQSVTTFVGQGLKGPVTELYIVCRRKDIKMLLPVINDEDPESFYFTEIARDVNKFTFHADQPITSWRKFLYPFSLIATGWRGILKKK